MQLTRTLILAAAFAGLAFATDAAAQSRHGAQQPSHQRAPGTPAAMDPGWAFAFDPLMSDPGWTMDYGPNVASPMLSRGRAGIGGPTDAEVQRMMRDMDREMAEMAAGPASGPLALDLGFGDIDFVAGGPGYAGMGGPTTGSAATYSYSSETDANGCTRSRSTSQSWPGPAPSTVTRSEGHCSGAPAASPEPNDDLDVDDDGPDEDGPDGAS